MLIRCPECHFEREIDTTKIPATATVATCPKCEDRFRFRDPQTGRSVLDGEPEKADMAETMPVVPAASTPSPHLPTEQDGDDPLPPGAVISGLDEADSDHDHPSATKGPEPGPEKETSFFGGDKAASPPSPREGGKKWWKTVLDGEGVPWEQPEQYGFFGSLYHTILRVLFRAPEFFSQLRSDANLGRPIIFFVLLSFFDTFISRLWSMNSLSSISQSATDPQVLAVTESLMHGLSENMLMVLLTAPFIALFRLFFLAGLYHLMVRLAQPDRADFFTVVRVIAYSVAPSVLCVVPMVGSLVGSLWFVACTFVGCKYALNLTWSRITLALAPLFILELAVLILVLRMQVSAF